jgi:PAS domain S-box-containing protein
LLPTGRFSRLVLAVAALLAAILFAFFIGIHTPETGLLLSDIVQSAIILWAAFCTFYVARRRTGYLRHLWMLLGSALSIATAAQVLETYYQNVAKLPSNSPWPSDILFLFWVTPAILMFLPRPTEESGGIHWLQVLDFAQVGVVALTAYLYFFYVPSRWEIEGPQMVLRVLRLQMVRDLVLAACFTVRATVVSTRSIRAFFARMAAFFLLAFGAGLFPLFRPRTVPVGPDWSDITWCAPYLFVAFFAATWKFEEEPIALEAGSSLRAMVASQVLPISIPLLVLFMGRRIVAEQLTIAWIAITASFLICAVRLVLTNEKPRRLAEDLLRAQQALRRSEHMFLTAFRSSPDAVGISAIPGGHFLEVNDSFTRLTGYMREETLGKSPVEMNLWKDPSHRARVVAKLREESEVREEEFYCRTKWGESRICQFSGALIELDGQLCALVIVRDITARKTAEEALRASEARFRNLVQDLHVGVVLLGPNAETLFANQAALNIFGFSEEDALGKKSSNFGFTAIREDGTEIPFAKRPGPRAIANRQPIRNEVVGWRRSETNTVLWTLVDALPHLTPEGDIANVILTISNITERKKAEEALRTSEERFRTLVQDLDVGIVLLGPAAEIKFANPAAQQMFGVSIQQAQGKSSAELDFISIREDGTEIPFSMRPGPRAISTKQAVQNEVIGWLVPGSSEVLWTLGNAVPQFARDGSISVVICSITNINERRHAEEALHQLSTRLLQLQDEERRRLGRELHDSLAQSVLAVNLNLAQATQSSENLSERSRRALAEARRLLQEMSREIRTLSYLLHPPLLDELGLVSAIKEYAEGFCERSGIGLELDLQTGFARLPQEAETALFRIVQESLSNIQRHSGSTTAMVCLRSDAACVNLKVIDQGRGIDKATMEAGNGKGGPRLGVGILGMRERMKQLGGKLDIESTPLGTTVRATIPLGSEAPSASSNPRSR